MLVVLEVVMLVELPDCDAFEALVDRVDVCSVPLLDTPDDERSPSSSIERLASFLLLRLDNPEFEKMTAAAGSRLAMSTGVVSLVFCEGFHHLLEVKNCRG